MSLPIVTKANYQLAYGNKMTWLAATIDSKFDLLFLKYLVHYFSNQSSLFSQLTLSWIGSFFVSFWNPVGFRSLATATALCIEILWTLFSLWSTDQWRKRMKLFYLWGCWAYHLALKLCIPLGHFFWLEVNSWSWELVEYQGHTMKDIGA